MAYKAYTPKLNVRDVELITRVRANEPLDRLTSSGIPVTCGPLALVDDVWRFSRFAGVPRLARRRSSKARI